MPRPRKASPWPRQPLRRTVLPAETTDEVRQSLNAAVPECDPEDELAALNSPGTLRNMAGLAGFDLDITPRDRRRLPEVWRFVHAGAVVLCWFPISRTCCHRLAVNVP